MRGNNIDDFPMVSIIMNCYNGQKYLKEAIDSVISQTYSNWQLIFWDNQSTDDSSIILKSYKDSRIKYILSDSHTTLGAARNLAAHKADGEWIAFLDCDDIWFEDKLSLQVNKILLSSNIISMVYGKTIMFSDDNIKYINIVRQDLPEGDIFEELAKENFISLSSALISKSMYWRVGGIENELNQAEDYDLFIKISYNSAVGVVDEPIVKYRVHANNLSNFQKDLAFTESIELLIRYLPDKRAFAGIKFWASLYMLYCIRRLKFTKDSLKYFVRFGSISTMLIFLRKILFKFK